MKLGFIGGGNMATALISGAIGQNVLPAGDVHVYDIVERCRDRLGDDYGVAVHDDCAAMIRACDMVVLAVKPNVVADVLAAQRAHLAGKALISIAAGWTSQMLSGALDGSTRILRVMPNTPALCGMGMTCLSLAHTLNEGDKAFACRLFAALGKLEWVHEGQMEAVVGVSGSGPAYAYLFIEALADAGVHMGLPRAQAQLMAAQTLKGAAEMVLTSGSHPGFLKDAVCSPGGTTIQAVRVLEEKGLRAAVIDGALAAYEKAMAMKA